MFIVLIMPCKQCNKVVSQSDRVFCRGPCHCEFHTICAKLDAPAMEILGQAGKNLIWMCDQCADLFDQEMAGPINIDPTTAAIQSMQAEMIKLTSAVAAITAMTAPATPTSWPIVDRPRIRSKRRLQPTESATPKPPQSSQGRRVLSNTIPVVSNNLSDDKYWIWLGSFPPSVTTTDICGMVQECLSCQEGDTVEATALVKKGVEVATYRAVTFKVGVDKKFRDAALMEDNWPAGVSFREFVDYGKQAAAEGPGFPKSSRTASPMA